MAVQSSFYVPDGSTRTFPSTKHIATKQHVGVYFQRALDSIWETALSTSYELVNNSIVFDSAVDSVLYIQIEIRVVDTTAELIDSPSTIALVAASIADVNTVADSILDVNTVADNISSVQNTSAINADISTVASVSTNVTTVAGVSTSIPTVAGISANVTTVAGVSGDVTTVANSIANVNTNAINIADINSVATAVVPNIAEILLANDNATTATTQAGIATTQAINASSSATQAELYEWEAEAERLTADSYATEAEDTFVNLVTSDGDGTFTYTPTTDYSALHWAAKAATFNPASYYNQTEIDEFTQIWQNQATPITPDANADYTLTADENKFGRLVLADGSWLSAHNIIVDNTERSLLVDASGLTVNTTVKTSAGTGVPVLAGIKVWLLCDGTNVIRVENWESSNPTGVSIGGGETLYPDGTIYGENALGSYTKYPNGDLVCKKSTISITFTLTAASVSVTFPHSFIYMPEIVSGLICANPSTVRRASCWTSNHTTTTFVLWGCNITTYDGSFEGIYTAIGRWK